jgi:hypothetical protein
MNNNLPGELIGELIAQYENDGFNDISDSEMMRALYELQQYRKAAGEPVVSVIFKGGWPEPNSAAPIAGSQALLDGVHEFYLGSQPAPVFPNEAQLRDLFEAWFASDCSFDRSPEATDDDNYAWKESLWHTWQQCRAAMLNHSGDASEKVDASLISEGNNQAGNSSVSIRAEFQTMMESAPQQSLLPHHIRELVNELRDVAIECHGKQQLRERIARIVNKYVAIGAKTEIRQPEIGAETRICQPTQGEWIKCSERMPEEHEPVLVHQEGGVIFCAEHEDGEFYPDEFPNVPKQGCEITHWMPLPIAPTQDSRRR